MTGPELGGRRPYVTKVAREEEIRNLYGREPTGESDEYSIILVIC